jgi:hypothetical protein
MGEHGYETVCNRTVDFVSCLAPPFWATGLIFVLFVVQVVKDLLVWYKLGKDRHALHQQDVLRFAFIIFVLVAIVPFSIAALFIYDILVSHIRLLALRFVYTVRI